MWNVVCFVKSALYRILEDAKIPIRVTVDELGLLRVEKVHRVHTKQLSRILSHIKDHGNILLIRVVIALDRIIIHRH